MKHAWMFVLAVAVVSAYARDYVWVSGSTDWGDPASYRDASGEKPQNLPGEDDVLNFPNGAELVIESSDAVAWERLDAIKSITLDNATVTFDCDRDVTLNCGIKSMDDTSSVIKKGKGVLELKARGKVPYDNKNWYDAYVNFKIEEGSLKIYQQELSPKTMLLRDVTISDGGVLWVNNEGYLQVASLKGCGLVTNDCSVASGAYFQLNGPDGSFSGDIHGKFTMYVNGGRTDLWGENNSWGDTMLLNGGKLGLKRIGSHVSGSKAPGSVGQNELTARGGSGSIIYLGDGETTTRTLTAWNKPSLPFVFDAGAVGGLELLGSFAMCDVAKWQGMYHLLLAGSNTTECVFCGDIVERSYSSTNYAFYVTKDGTGTWYFKEKNRSFGGVVEVRNGTLKFDSVAEKGVASSLGKADRLSSQKTGFPRDSEKDEDYAFVLGCGETEGAMEFVGKENCRTTTRPVVLNGVGALVNNSTGSELRLRGVSALTEENAILVLDGTNTLENTVWDVTDGKGIVSVEKRGSGIWVLGGTNSFSGTLDVKDGTLVVRNSKGTPYSWFKLIIRQIAATHPDIGVGSSQASGDTRISVVEWGLYDVDGKRVNLNTDKDEVYKKPFRTLRPGQIAIGKEATLEVGGSYANGNYRGPGELIDGTAEQMQIYVDYTAPALDNPDSWVPVVMRLSDDAGVVGSYDIYYPNIKSDSYRGRNPSAISIEGSVDGYHWEPLVETNDIISMSTTEGWLTDNKKWQMAADRRGIPIRGVSTNDCDTLSNVSTVRVASGATLKIEGEVVLSDIAVDCVNGAGTIDGAILAETGVLRIEGAVKNGDRIPLKCINTETFGNLLLWDVFAAGKLSHFKAKINRQGDLRLYSPTFSVIIR